MNRLPAHPQRPRRGIVAHEPQPGYWLMRAVRLGPLLPASIERIEHEPGDRANILDTGAILIANIGLVDCDPTEVWCGRRERAITKEEYELAMDQLKWDDRYDPAAAALHPRKRIDLAGLRPIEPTE